MNQLEKKDGKKAVIKTNRGDMTFVLLDEAAPKAVRILSPTPRTAIMTA